MEEVGPDVVDRLQAVALPVANRVLVHAEALCQVESDTESLGRRTSIAVVLAIFLVIVVNAVFSIFFAVLGV